MISYIRFDFTDKTCSNSKYYGARRAILKAPCAVPQRRVLTVGHCFGIRLLNRNLLRNFGGRKQFTVSREPTGSEPVSVDRPPAGEHDDKE
ncbi:hypothetical protein GGE07_004530 [Sinorhizobium terangae]|nr:hypothetical protein [Sinorhizobium terangae]